MLIEASTLPEVLILTPRRFGDARGWFSETFSARVMAGAGIGIDWVQDNHSFSAVQGTLRGLHYQSHPHAQDKLVRCTRGAILDVAVDFRAGSPRFGQWVSQRLSAENGQQLLIPKGFLHGFVTLSPDVEVQYKCSDFYAPDCDGAVRWDDPGIGIDWGDLPEGGPVLSDKDKGAPLLKDAPRPFRYEGMK